MPHNLRGYLGRGMRIKHAKCVEDGVRGIWTDSDNNFAGYKSS